MNNVGSWPEGEKRERTECLCVFLLNSKTKERTLFFLRYLFSTEPCINTQSNRTLFFLYFLPSLLLSSFFFSFITHSFTSSHSTNSFTLFPHSFYSHYRHRYGHPIHRYHFFHSTDPSTSVPANFYPHPPPFFHLLQEPSVLTAKNRYR